MATFTVNGLPYTWPDQGGEGWASQVNDLIEQLTLTTLQKSGGSFVLAANVNFGSTYGLLAKHFTSISSNPSLLGAVRLSNADTVSWRNNANDADLPLTVGSSDRLTFGGAVVPTVSSSDALTNKTLTSPVINTGVSGTAIDTDSALAANSDTKLASQKAVKSYADAHINDTTAAHAGSAIGNTPSGNLAATDVQAALNELQSDVDTRATASALSGHTGNTSNPHSVTKTQVGLGNVTDVAQLPASYLDTDGTLAANSDVKVA
jgi:hypothetical protein